MLENSFRIGEWHVKPAAGQISRGDEIVHLEPRVMTVLSLLASNAGEVISREQLEAEAWPGVVVGYDALASSILKLRKALRDDSREPRYIVTVSKRGYRLIAPVEFDADNSADTATQKAGTADKPAARLRLLALAVIAGITVTLVGLFAWYQNKASIDAADVPVSKLKTLAVMPFTNISGEEKDEYFVDGVADDLATELSGLSGILVISSRATSRFKGKTYDPRQAGKDLGATYLLEGSVRKSGKRWRINARLIDSKVGTQLWAQRFEGSDSSLFESQDKIANSIVTALALGLGSKEQAKLNHHTTTNFDAYDLFLQGLKLFKVRTSDANKSAQDNYRNAIELDPNFSRAYSALSVSLTVDFWRGWSESPAETLDRSLAMAKESVRLDPTSPQAYWALGYAYLFRRQYKEAIEATKHAIEISPNFADGYGLLALINNHLGNGEEAARLVKKGMQLDPHYSWDYLYNLGRAYYTMGQYEEAVKTLQQALDRNDLAVHPRLYLVASYVALGQMEDASWEVEKLQIQSPDTTLKQQENDSPIADKTLQQQYLDRLRQAGLPE